jgi:hypothetical protein
VEGGADRIKTSGRINKKKILLFFFDEFSSGTKNRERKKKKNKKIQHFVWVERCGVFLLYIFLPLR